MPRSAFVHPSGSRASVICPPLAIMALRLLSPQLRRQRCPSRAAARSGALPTCQARCRRSAAAAWFMTSRMFRPSIAAAAWPEANLSAVSKGRASSISLRRELPHALGEHGSQEFGDRYARSAGQAREASRVHSRSRGNRREHCAPEDVPLAGRVPGAGPSAVVRISVLHRVAEQIGVLRRKSSPSAP